jgi:multidrug efflux system membrane fusion protein
MKRILLLLCGALLFGCSKAPEKPAEAATAESKPVQLKRNEQGDVTVTITEEAQKRIELKTEDLKAAKHTPELTAYGVVLDPSSLITAQTEIATATVGLETSKKAAARAKSLFDQGENVARKTLESAEADLRSNEIKLKSLQEQIALEWGQKIAQLSAPELQSLITNLLANKVALARVDLPVGETISSESSAARISAIGGKWQSATVVSRATKVDAKTQGESFIVQCESAQLRPGAAVTALLQATGDVQNGVLVPDAAVVQFIGKAWVYVQSGTNAFTRAEISQRAPVDGGWFQTNGPKAGERVVTQGAQELLSEEQKSQISVD